MLNSDQVIDFMYKVVDKKIFLKNLMKPGSYFIPNGFYTFDHDDYLFYGVDERGDNMKWYISDGFLDWAILEETTIKSNTCSCGAKYTSNPNFHLPFCEFAKKISNF